MANYLIDLQTIQVENANGEWLCHQHQVAHKNHTLSLQLHKNLAVSRLVMSYLEMFGYAVDKAICSLQYLKWVEWHKEVTNPNVAFTHACIGL